MNVESEFHGERMLLSWIMVASVVLLPTEHRFSITLCRQELAMPALIVPFIGPTTHKPKNSSIYWEQF
jgi:hypothetical protein